MFSLFKSAPAVVSEAPTTAPVVDLNVLGKEPQILDLPVVDPAVPRSRFSLWPFGSSAKRESTASETPVQLDSEGKVIAMKANNEDDFIDIQVRKLSYAEAASLKLSASAASASPVERKASVVIDHDRELENSITDLELATELGGSKKFRQDLVAYEELSSTYNHELDFEEALEKEEDIALRLKKSTKRNKRRGSNKK